MNFLQLLKRRAAVVWYVTALLVALGVLSAFQLPSGIYPEIEFPRVVVVARTGGAPPATFVTQVTRPLEQALASVLGVQRIKSKTIRGATEISLQFGPSSDMWRALQLTESRVAEVRSRLPADTDLVVERVTTGSFPVVTFNVSGAVDPRQLHELAEFVVQPALANVPGVGRIEVLGGDVREVEVILDPEKTAAMGLSPAAIAETLRRSMTLSAVGRVDENTQSVTVMVNTLPQGVADLRQFPIGRSADGSPIALDAVAQVSEGHEDRLVRIGGPLGETVGISVARAPGASTPAVVDAAIAAVQALGQSLPAGVQIQPVYDQAHLVDESMSSVRDAIILGIGLCALVIALFLRSFRLGLIAALTVPVTLAITFIAMRLGHQTLNLMSLGGMAVAIGLIVDDAIVVVEAIARHFEQEHDRSETAVSRATMTVAPAVVGTTATTVVVLIPLAFLSGVVGAFFRALAFTLGVAVLVSLLVAVLVVPLLVTFKASRTKARVPVMERKYRRIMSRAMKVPGRAALLLVVLIGAGAVCSGLLERGFLPALDEGAFVLDYFLPAGTSLAVTESFAKDIERELHQTPEVQTFTRRMGAEMGPAAATELSRGDIMVRLGAGAHPRSSEAVVEDLRQRLGQYPEVRIEFVQVLEDVLADLAGNPRPIEVKFFGQDYSRLNQLADKFAHKLAEVPGVVDVYSGHEREIPELRFALNRDAIARLGLTTDAIEQELHTALSGAAAGQMQRFDRLVDVRVRYPDVVRFDPQQVRQLPLVAGGRLTAMSTVADVTTQLSSSELMHEALQPVVAVTADHGARDLGAIAADIDRALSEMRLPAGYRAVVGGEIESERATLSELALAGCVALLLVLTVLAGQFHRSWLPLLVLGTIPVAVVGAVLALLVTHTALNASSLMGCVLLVGLVVKNGVLLLEEAERQLDAGLDIPAAVLAASERRVRPIIMTTVATLAGLLPLGLGIGAGAELQQPLAIAVLGGLLSSTLATLGLLPPLATWLLSTTAARSDPRH